MKEATGEANMTIVTVVLIAAVVAIATPIITGMMSSAKSKTCCTNNGGVYKNGNCYEVGENGSLGGTRGDWLSC